MSSEPRISEIELQRGIRDIEADSDTPVIRTFATRPLGLLASSLRTPLRRALNELTINHTQGGGDLSTVDTVEIIQRTDVDWTMRDLNDYERLKRIITRHGGGR